jgi:hypothetical protein
MNESGVEQSKLNSMKPKLILCLALVLSGLFHPLSAQAVSMWTQLNSTNLNNQRLAFTIKADKTENGVHFRVTIESKSATLSKFLDAHLTVCDREKQIIECAVEKTPRNKGVVYEFTVSSEFLAKSQFTFGNMAESNGQPMPAGDFYWFYLKDFTDEK